MSLFSGLTLRRCLMTALAATALTTPAAMAETTQTPAAPAPEAAATTAPEYLDPAPDVLRIGSDLAERMTMPVQIGGIGPYPFIIDTGSHRSIVAKELATQLSLQTLPPVEIISMAGRETVDSVHLEEMRFGTQVVSDLPALSIARSDLGSAGLIGLDGLKDKRLTLDFRKRQMSVGRSSPTGISYDRNTIVVKARSKFGQLILVNSRLDGKRVNVILDTGAEISVGNMALFNSLRQQRLVIPPRKVTLHSVTGQEIEAQFTVVSRLQIDFMHLENVPMVFLDAAPFAELELADKPAMLLGMRMLRMFDRVAIDFGARHIDFQLPQTKNHNPNAERLLAAL